MSVWNSFVLQRPQFPYFETTLYISRAFLITRRDNSGARATRANKQDEMDENINETVEDAVPPTAWYEVANEPLRMRRRQRCLRDPYLTFVYRILCYCRLLINTSISTTAPSGTSGKLVECKYTTRAQRVKEGDPRRLHISRQIASKN